MIKLMSRRTAHRRLRGGAGDRAVWDAGEVTDTSTEELLRNFMTEFHGFIARVYTVLPRPV
jgi:hypothetical protein